MDNTNKNNKKQNKLKIVLSAYDVSLLEEATKMVTQKLLQIKSKFEHPIPLPIRRTLISLPTSPHRYKYSQEQFEKVMHRRAIFVNYPNKQDIENINKLKLPGTVDIKWVNYCY